MGVTTIDEIFKGPWGIVESRRQEIESGYYGAFDRIYEDEIDNNFLPIRSVAELLDCHESTARDWLRRCDVRYIARGLAHLFYKNDVDEAKAKWAAREAERKPSKAKVAE